MRRVWNTVLLGIAACSANTEREPSPSFEPFEVRFDGNDLEMGLPDGAFLADPGTTDNEAIERFGREDASYLLVRGHLDDEVGVGGKVYWDGTALDLSDAEFRSCQAKPNDVRPRCATIPPPPDFHPSFAGNWTFGAPDPAVGNDEIQFVIDGAPVGPVLQAQGADWPTHFEARLGGADATVFYVFVVEDSVVRHPHGTTSAAGLGGGTRLLIPVRAPR